jgi:hypothetical protein
MPTDWSKREVRLAVESYFDMLCSELSGLPINKTASRKALLPKLSGRSNGSVEFKNCNISAALLEMGYPSISGYKPRWNYQRSLLREAIDDFIVANPDTLTVFKKSAETSPPSILPDNILSIVDASPPPMIPHYRSVSERPYTPRIQTANYLEMESRKRSIGLAGEELVLNYERQRLINSGKHKLADKIEHISVNQGDGAGFDIKSYDHMGRELFIEVKTTKYRKEAPFFISSNEVEFAKSHASRYSLYRVYQYSKNPRLFMLPGDITKNCNLSVTQYRAGFGNS